MNRKSIILIPLLLLAACNFMKPPEKIETNVDVTQIVVPDTVSYFEAFEVSTEILMDHTCKYAGPILKETSEGCSVTIMAEVVEVSYHNEDVSEWHTFSLRPLKSGTYIIRVRSKNGEDLVDSTFVR